MSAVITEPPLNVYNPLSIIEKMVQSGTDPERLGKFLDLAERWERDQAIKAYNNALCDCQAEVRPLAMDAANGSTKVPYLSMPKLNSYAHPIYTRHGFTVSFSEAPPQREGWIRTVMDIRHRGGHCVEKYKELPHDGIGPQGKPIGGMNTVQGACSSDSYAQRRLLCGWLNITIVGEDKDGAGPNLGGEEIKVINQIIEEIRQLEEARPPKKLFVLEAFVRWLKADAQSLDDVPMTQFSKAVYELNRRRKELAK